MATNPFSFLNKTVNVLIADDSSAIVAMLEGMLDIRELYSVSSAGSTAEALALLETDKKRYHVCLFDLGLDDIEHNEFYLLDQYRKTLPFIIISCREELEKGFECSRHGAKTIIRKASPDFEKRLFCAINKFALESILCPGYHENPSPIICRCMEGLLKTKPGLVKEWAENLNIAERYLRNEWMGYAGVNAKHSLCIFHLFSWAFKYAEIMYNSPNNEGNEIVLTGFVDSLSKSKCYERCKKYFLANESVLKNSICSLHEN
jgi:CheY-like chemotaxis protein